MTTHSLPSVAIVTPAYNAGRFLLQAIESVQRQTLKNYEHIIINDGSTDNTLDVALSVDDMRITVRTINNNGVSFARNEGLRNCRAPYVLFLDADDILRPDALQHMVDVLEAHPQSPACFAQHVKIPEAGVDPSYEVQRPRRLLPRDKTLWHLLAKNIIVNGGALCIRTEAARAVGGFKTDLKLGEDWEFWCRLALLGDYIPIQNLVAVDYRQTSTGGNRQQRGSILKPNFTAVEAIYAIPDLALRFSSYDLSQRKRKAKIDSYWSSAKFELTHQNYWRFTGYLFAGLIMYPDSILQPKLIYRLLSGAFNGDRRVVSKTAKK